MVDVDDDEKGKVEGKERDERKEKKKGRTDSRRNGVMVGLLFRTDIL